MTASSRGSKAVASLIGTSRTRTRNPGLCSSCLSHLSHSRPYSIAAEALKPLSAPPLIHHEKKHIPPVSSSPVSEYITKSGILLSRPPLLTKPPTAFEKSFFFYQKRLNERLVMPFSRYFYFKKDTPADTDWKIKARERGGASQRELGGYQAYGEEAWNDELLVGDKTSEVYHTVESLVRDAEVRAVEGKDGKAVVTDKSERKIERPLTRITEADRKGDQRRLDRKLNRTLYLVVKREGAHGGWGFPSGRVEGRENLHQAAERILVQTAGVNMNTWIIGHAPVGHHVLEPHYIDSKLARPGEKTFFLKGRIMAGQADLKGNLFGLEDFKWLTRNEVEEHVGLRYWSSVRGMLGER